MTQERHTDYHRLGGTLTIVNNHVKRVVYTCSVDNISDDIDTFFLPVSSASINWRFFTVVPGKRSTGKINSSGTIQFVTNDTIGTLIVRNLDILILKPYLPRERRNDAYSDRRLVGPQIYPIVLSVPLPATTRSCSRPCFSD